MVEGQLVLRFAVPDEQATTALLQLLRETQAIIEVEDSIELLPPQAHELLAKLASEDRALTVAELIAGTRISRDSARAVLSKAVDAGAAQRVEAGFIGAGESRATTYALTERGRRLVEKSHR